MGDTEIRPEEHWLGESRESFAEAARLAVENAEADLARRGIPHPREYDVTLRITAEGPLSDYRVFITPHG